MSEFMAFNRFLTREQVIENCNIPPHLIEEVFAVLKPISGHGASSLYLETIVDRQLDKYFGQTIRLRAEDPWFPSYKEEAMNQTWADTVAGDEEAISEMPLERLLVDEREAAQMLGVSRRKIFELNKLGVLSSRLVGSRKLYSVKKLREFAEGGCE
jgi:hypothetical protein